MKKAILMFIVELSFWRMYLKVKINYLSTK